VIGGVRGVCEMRQARSPKQPAPVETWADLGLSGRVFADYRRAARKAGFRLARFEAIPIKGFTSLPKLPWLSRFFIFGISARLDKPR